MVFKNAREIASKYPSSPSKLTLATLGSHSALDICQGAKAEGFRTLVVCQKGRDKTYSRFYKTRNSGGASVGVVDEVLLLGKFADIAKPEITHKLVSANSIFIPHRSFEVYVGYEKIENEFAVPIFGNRLLLRAEERTESRNQYYLMEKAGVRFPRRFARPSEIRGLALVKAPEAKRSYERAFFFVTGEKDYREKSAELIRKGIITEEGLRSAVIEEYILGAQFNFNFFTSPLTGETELLGTDTRRQTNLDGILRLPAPQQTELLKYARANNIEIGHIACTIRESMLDKVIDLGERFAAAAAREYPPGIIGPFALQGAVIPEEKGEEIVIFDVSLRMPGSPGVRFTPYGEYLHGVPMSAGRRIAVEIKRAAKKNALAKVVT
ncbi:MAG: formate--phosphoribosylaminoimidazolecarboxamide ligase family protein [Candidatus Micrarchaeota archaeon]